MLLCTSCNKELNKFHPPKYGMCLSCFSTSEIKSKLAEENAKKRRNYDGVNNPNYRGQTKVICPCGKEVFRRISPNHNPKQIPKYCSVDCKKQFSKSFFVKFIYKNIILRSSWELAFAQWLDEKGYTWVYEPPSIKTPYGYYSVDFYVNELNLYFEVKSFFRDDNARLKFEYFKQQYPNTVLADKTYLKELGFKFTKYTIINPRLGD